MSAAKSAPSSSSVGGDAVSSSTSVSSVSSSRVHSLSMAALQQADPDTCRWCRDYTKRLLSKLADESDDEQGMVDGW